MNGFFTYQLEPAPPHKLLDQVYQSGEIVVYNSESAEDEPVARGSYCVPYEVAAHFEAFIESLETDLPIFVSVGSIDQATKAATIGASLQDIVGDYEDYSLNTPIKSKRSLEHNTED